MSIVDAEIAGLRMMVKHLDPKWSRIIIAAFAYRQDCRRVLEWNTVTNKDGRLGPYEAPSVELKHRLFAAVDAIKEG